MSAVLFGIGALHLLISFLVHAAATLIIGVVIWLVGLRAIVLIFSKESGPSSLAHQQHMFLLVEDDAADIHLRRRVARIATEFKGGQLLRGQLPGGRYGLSAVAEL